MVGSIQPPVETPLHLMQILKCRRIKVRLMPGKLATTTRPIVKGRYDKVTVYINATFPGQRSSRSTAGGKTGCVYELGIPEVSLVSI